MLWLGELSGRQPEGDELKKAQLRGTRSIVGREQVAQELAVVTAELEVQNRGTAADARQCPSSLVSRRLEVEHPADAGAEQRTQGPWRHRVGTADDRGHRQRGAA